MRTASPLRYPGGKSSLADLLAQVRRLNGLGQLDTAEPFAGGAGASLSLLYSEETPRIIINDFDSAIHDFWWTITNRPEPFMTLLKRIRPTMAEWRRQRKIYKSSRASRLRRGFAAFFLNRCNRSGIIVNGGPIGGLDQSGKWKINARYNKQDLTTRIRKVIDYRQRIAVCGEDGMDLLTARKVAERFFFIDPPYYEKGKTLYLNSTNHEYHARLARTLKQMKDEPWVLTYDDCPQIRKFYEGWTQVRPFCVRYGAAKTRVGRELLVCPEWMTLPTSQSSTAIVW